MALLLIGCSTPTNGPTSATLRAPLLTEGYTLQVRAGGDATLSHLWEERFGKSVAEFKIDDLDLRHARVIYLPGGLHKYNWQVTIPTKDNRNVIADSWWHPDWENADGLASEPLTSLDHAVVFHAPSRPAAKEVLRQLRDLQSH